MARLRDKLFGQRALRGPTPTFRSIKLFDQRPGHHLGDATYDAGVAIAAALDPASSTFAFITGSGPRKAIDIFKTVPVDQRQLVAQKAIAVGADSNQVYSAMANAQLEEATEATTAETVPVFTALTAGGKIPMWAKVLGLAGAGFLGWTLYKKHKTGVLSGPGVQWYRVTWPGDSGVYPAGPALESTLRWLRSKGYDEGQIKVKAERVTTRPPGVGLRGDPSLRVGQRFDYFGQTFEIIKIFRDKQKTIQIARRSTDSFGKTHLIDHRSFPSRDFDRQNLKPVG